MWVRRRRWGCLPVRDNTERQIVKDVRAHGWHCLGVMGDEHGPSFSYTIGVQATFDHPEIIVFGLDHGTMHLVLANVVEEIRKGASFAQSCVSEEVLENFVVAFDPVIREFHDEYLGAAQWYRRHTKSRRTLAAVQCCWPDKKGHFPWQPRCAAAIRSLQPVLSSRRA